MLKPFHTIDTNYQECMDSQRQQSSMHLNLGWYIQIYIIFIVASFPNLVLIFAQTFWQPKTMCGHFNVSAISGTY